MNSMVLFEGRLVLVRLITHRAPKETLLLLHGPYEFVLQVSHTASVSISLSSVIAVCSLTSSDVMWRVLCIDVTFIDVTFPYLDSD